MLEFMETIQKSVKAGLVSCGLLGYYLEDFTFFTHKPNWWQTPLFALFCSSVAASLLELIAKEPGNQTTQKEQVKQK